MDKNTLGHYGWIVIVVIIIVILIGAAVPFVNLIKANVSFNTEKLIGIQEDSLNNIDNYSGENTNYTPEDVNESGGKLVAIGLTNPYYVMAKFNDDFSSVEIFKNGKDSDGLMKDFSDDDTSPMSERADVLTSIMVKNGVASIGNYAFRYCAEITDVRLPDSVATLGEYSFSNCNNMKTFDGGKGLQTISYGAFMLCSSLTDITIGNKVTEIGPYAFYGDKQLPCIAIPNTVTTIGGGAFYDCWALTSIVIPEGVTTINGSVFRKCTSLTSITIPASTTTIKNMAFYGTTVLTDVYYAGTAEQWDAIIVDLNNSILESATIHYGTTGE